MWFNNFIDTDCGGSYLETWCAAARYTLLECSCQLPVDGRLVS